MARKLDMIDLGYADINSFGCGRKVKDLKIYFEIMF